MIAINGTLRELFEEGTIVPVSNVIRLYEGGTLVKTIDEGIESIREKSSIETEPFGVVPVSNVTLSFSGLNGLSTEKEYDLVFDSIFRLNDELQPTYTSRRYTSLMPKYDKRSNKVTITALDQFGKLSSQYQPLDITYPCTYYDWVSLFFYTVTGLEMEQFEHEVYNGDYILTKEPNLDSTYSNATVASRIAMFSLSLVYVSPSNKVRFVPLSKFKSSAIDYTITDKAKDFTDDTDRFKTLGINTLVLGLQSDIDGENVSREDSSMVSVDGTVELRLDDIPFIPTESEKESIIDAMFDEIKGFKYKAYNLTFGVGAYFFLEIGDNVAQEILNYGTEESPVYSNIPIFSVENIFAGSIQTVFSATSESVSQTESKWEQLSPSKRTEIRVDKVNQRITSTIEMVDDNTSKLSEIEQDLDSISLAVGEIDELGERVSEVELNVDGIRLEVSQLGGYNIISNIIGRFGTLDWTFESKPFIAQKTSPYAKTKTGSTIPTIYAINNNGTLVSTIEVDTQSKSGFRFWHSGKMLSKIATVDSGTDYSVHLKTKGTGYVNVKLREYTSALETNKNNYHKETMLGTTTNTTNWATFERTLTIAESTMAVCLVFESNVNVYLQQYAIISDGSFNIGQPKPYGQSLTDVNNRVDSLSARVEIAEDTVDIFTSKVETVEGTVNNHTAQLTIQAGEISSKVDSNGIISSINQTSETVKINASKINLTGYVTVSSLSTAGSTTINGGNITTGTLNASNVSITNLNATNITTGTLNVNRIPNLSADKITTGTLNADRIGAGTIVANKISVGRISDIAVALGTMSSGAVNNGSFSSGSFGGTGNFPSGYLAGNNFYRSGVYTSLAGYFTSSLRTGTTLGITDTSTGQQVSYISQNGSWRNANSDIRLKDNVKDVHDEYDNLVYSIPIIEYNYKGDDTKRIGINANFVDSMLPKDFTETFIYTMHNGYYGVDYAQLVSPLIKVAQHHNTRLIELEYELEQLRKEIKE